MAHKKAGGSSNNGGKDHTLFAKAEGRVSFETKRNARTFVSVMPLADAAE